jgi:ATP-dependent helicase HrpB
MAGPAPDHRPRWSRSRWPRYDPAHDLPPPRAAPANPLIAALPVESSLPALLEALRTQEVVLLQAPPGAGKTTRVPLALLDAPWCRGKIMMLEPRRLAARAAARRLASQLGEKPGATVGITTRTERVGGPDTRIEVVTEGILTRRLQRDPALEGTSLVIFDEFHERSLQADLGLALCLHSRELLRPDLRLLVMSATLDIERLATLLHPAPIIRSEGRMFPVTVHHRGPAPDSRTAAATVARAVGEALDRHGGSLLVFLPGRREIEQVAELLAVAGKPGTVITPLHGQLPPEAQDAAIQPAPEGLRKVVLATDIAETSLTIEGISVVVDSGLARRPRFDPRSGLTRLETVRISRANAEQRCGRAGRLGPGICIRLWPEADQQRLAAQTAPEILEADLAPLVLSLACWGAAADELLWLDPPPVASLAQARGLLEQLGGLDAQGRVTEHGRALEALGTHPRLAHMLLAARQRGLGRTAALLAALLEERDPLDRNLAGSDLRLRLRALADDASGHTGVHAGVRRRMLTQTRRWTGQLGIAAGERIDPDAAGLLLAFAYPDRIALRRPGPEGRFLLSSGRGAYFPRSDDLAEAPCIVAGVLDAGQREAVIHLAAPLDRAALNAEFGDLIRTEDRVDWDPETGAVSATREQRLGALLLDSRPLSGVDPAQVAGLLLSAIARAGLDCLPWTPEARRLRERIGFAHAVEPGDWPDVSDRTLLRDLPQWLGPWLSGMSRMSHLRNLDLAAALRARLDWSHQQRLDQIAPSHINVPSGSRLAIDYGRAEQPALAVRIQEIFGWTETPRIGGGRVPLTLHLLSPARRPVQITGDLAGFWERTYPEVKKDLKGRYPKHYWPDDPRQAEARRGTRPRTD